MLQNRPLIAWTGALGTLLLVYVWAVVDVTGYAAFQDFGEWIYQGYIVQFLITGGESDLVGFKSFPVPYSAGQLLLGGLSLAMSPTTAGVVAILVQGLAGLWAVALLVHKRGLDARWATPVLGCIVVFASAFWNGYGGYQLGLIVLVLYLAVPAHRRVQFLPVAAASLAAFWCHGFMYLAVVMVIVVFALAQRTVLPALLGGLPSGMLTIWYVLASPPDPSGDLVSTQSVVELIAYKGYSLAKAGGYQNLIVNGEGDGRLLMLAGSLANVAFVGTILIVVAVVLVRGRVHGPRLDAEMVAALLLGTAGLLLPSGFAGLVNAGERLMVPALVLAVVSAFASDRLPRFLPVLPASAAIAGLALTLVSAATLGAKADAGDPTPADPAPTFEAEMSSRTDTLFGHRLDQMETRFELARTAWPDEAPPDGVAFDTAMLE